MADNLTAFSNQCGILSFLWMNYRDDQDFIDFIEYNDLGLPLSYAIENNIVTPNGSARELISETFNLLLAALKIEDEGFESLDEMLDLADQQDEQDEIE